MMGAATAAVRLDRLPELISSISITYILNTVVLFAIVLLVRYLLIRSIKRRSIILSREQRRWISHIKGTSIILIIIGLSFIWAPHLHTFAISLAAFAVALVIATKEMILCLMGALVRVTSQPFRIGDWITIDGLMGEVIDVNAFSTSLQEVEMKDKGFHYSGRTIQIPNSKYFTSNVENANFNKDFIYTDFKIHVETSDISVNELLDALILIADRYYAPFRERSYAFRRKVESKSFIDIPDPEPMVFVQKNSFDAITFKIRAFVPTAEAERFAHRITRDFEDRYHAIKRVSTASRKKAKNPEAEK